MPPPTPPPPPPPPKQPARALHRALSLFGALALVAFVATGIGLEHASELGLDARFAPAAFARWLGYRASPAVAFDAGEHRLAQVGDLLVLDDRALVPRIAHLAGARAIQDGVLVLANDEVLVLDRAGDLVDHVALPSSAHALGNAGATIVADTAAGRFALDDALANWQPWTAESRIDWSRPAPVDDATQRRYEALYYARALTWASALSALHSGRIFGRHGWIVVDVAAALLLALALSGAWLARQRS
jgi:hypothetical protein